MNLNLKSDSDPNAQSRKRLEEFIRDRLPVLCSQPRATSVDSMYALPDASLVLLRDIVEELGVRTVFEFGTGRSTKMFLDCNCRVTVIDDSLDWLRRTMIGLSWEPRARLRTKHLPLRTVFEDGSPFRSWRLNRELRAALRDADLVFLDSPAYPPFREHALVATLRQNHRALVVLDDANMPAVERFCVRLTRRNRLMAFHSRLDHGLYFVAAPPQGKRIHTLRGWGETAQAWYRFLFSGRHWFKPRTSAAPM